MAIGTAAAIIGSAVVGGVAASSAANKQAKAVQQASNTAAQTERESMDKQLAFLREGSAAAEKELRPYADEGNAARRMYNAAHGVAPTKAGDTLAAARGDYDNAFNNSTYWRDAQYSTAQGLSALNSTNAAAGRGSSVNSGKAMRAASDLTLGYRGDATNKFTNALGGIADTGYAASAGIGNAKIGQANNMAASQRAAGNAIGGYQYGGGVGAANAQAAGTNAMGSLLAYGLGNAFGNMGYGQQNAFGAFAPGAGAAPGWGNIHQPTGAATGLNIGRF